jgi:hypothetical protein
VTPATARLTVVSPVVRAARPSARATTKSRAS